MQKRGQSAIEYTMLIGIVLFALIPLFYFSTRESQSNIKVSQVDDMVNKLINAADLVYSLGPGSRKIVQITVPSGVQSFDIESASSSINVRISNRGEVSDFHAKSSVPNLKKGTIAGKCIDTVFVNKGVYNVPVHTDAVGNVIIGEDECP